MYDRTWRRFLFLFVCLFISILLMIGCQKVEKESGLQPETMHSKTLHKETIPPSYAGFNVRAPIQMERGQFNTVSGWLNNETIIYVTNIGLGSNVYTYHIFTGESKLIYESEAPVASVYTSPSGKRILVYTVPTTYEGVISILDQDGKEIMTERLEVFDLTIEWNPYDENLLLISSFKENWDFSTFQLNIDEKKLVEVQLKEPFAYWVAKDELIYLDWSIQDPSLFAPLMKKSIFKTDEKKVLDDIFHVKTIKGIIMTITVTSDKMGEAKYSFQSNDFRKLADFSIPHLTRFSDWLVPYFDFDERNHFYSFQPLFSTDADTYTEGFQLFSFDLVKGEKTAIFEVLQNEPLSCSPNGKHCLYGFYFEKLINVDTKQMIQLVKE
ncbi:hypothetical protein [Bacillus sp. FJAT-29790]|uniref:YqgU-like beta propeller domain-containing protein n=1 Tax=Bacillus sp. FJAT-29790 TaxID=1895002 RepID=UPI00349F0B0D